MVPDVVERLHTLKALHERAAQFAGSVTYISDQQDQMAKQMKELESLLQQVSYGGLGHVDNSSMGTNTGPTPHWVEAG